MSRMDLATALSHLKAAAGRAERALRLGLPAFLALAFLTASAAPAMDLPAAGDAGARTAPAASHADFGAQAPSAAARVIADWVAISGDNRGLPFIVIDKGDARLFLFDPHAALRAAAPVLLGLARGDDSPPSIGDRPLSLIAPAERITPAGRFVASAGHNLGGGDILWIDYDAAVSLHRATDRKPGLTAKSRLDRLATASTLDNRITHGCINVPAQFFDAFVRPAFRGTDVIVYVLPEIRSSRAVFDMSPQGSHA
jgi:hypothetical protein